MAEPRRSRRDHAYLAFFAIQFLAMLFVDLVPYLYPKNLWEPADGPLHFLGAIRRFYIATYNDPFFQTPHDALPSWYRLFTYLELYYQLPAAAWILYQLATSRGPTTALTELGMLIFGIECALTTLTCLYDVFSWDPAVYSIEQKNVFIYNLYGPFVVIPTLMALDMSWRLLSRSQAAEKAKTL